MSEKPQSLKRFALLSVVLVVLLFGVANLDELTGQATGGEGGCGGTISDESDSENTIPYEDDPLATAITLKRSGPPIVEYRFGANATGSFSTVSNKRASLPWLVYESGEPEFVHGDDGTSLNLGNTDNDKVKIINNPGLKDLLSDDAFALALRLKDLGPFSLQKKDSKGGFVLRSRLNAQGDRELKFNTTGQAELPPIFCAIDSSDWVDVLISAQSGGTKTMYINGEACASSQIAGDIELNAANNLRITGNASIDRIKIWKKSLNADEATNAHQGDDPSGLVADYSFKDSTGTLKSNTIVYNEFPLLPGLKKNAGTPKFVNGQLGRGLRLAVENGVKDVVVARHSEGLKKLMSSSEMTLSLVVEDVEDLSVQKKRGADGFVIFSNAQRVKFNVGKGLPPALCDLEGGEGPMHLAFSAERNGLKKIYLNGELCGDEEDSGSANLNPAANLRIRGELTFVDKFKIWNRVLSAEEVKDDSANGLLEEDDEGEAPAAGHGGSDDASGAGSGAASGAGQAEGEGQGGAGSSYSGAKPRCQPLNGGLVTNPPCRCGNSICYYEGDVCTPYANHCQGGPKISDPDPGSPHGTPTQKRECEHDFDCKGSLRQCLGKVKYKVTNYADCDNPNYPQPGFCKVKTTVEAECPVNMECIKNTRPDGVGDRCGFIGTPDVGQLGGLSAHIMSFDQAYPDGSGGLIPATIFIKVKVDGMKQFAGQDVTVTVAVGNVHRTDDTIKIFTAYNFFGRRHGSSIDVANIKLDQDGHGDGVLRFTLRPWPIPPDGSLPGTVMIPSGTYQLSGGVYIQSGKYTVEEMKMMDLGSRGKLDPFFVVP